jgi:5'-deoxynucleotidase YfbR-like HD superfamily hydrolase
MAAAAPPARAWQRMLSGRRLDLLDPSPLDVEIEDVALGLSRVARWNGQTIGDHGFSVAQHSLLVVDLVGAEAPPGLRLAALLHDASEYVTSDLITPFKAAIGTAYKALEKRVEAAVFLRFGLPAHPPAAWMRQVKDADRVAAFLEATQLAGFTEAEARRIFGFRGEAAFRRLVPDPPEVAREAFLQRFRALEKLVKVRGLGLPERARAGAA